VAPFLLSGAEAPTLVYPSTELFSTTAHHKHSDLLRYAPENTPSPRVVNRKMATEKPKIHYKTQK